MAWRIPELASRAALLVEGTAFLKVARLSPEKLRVNNQSGIQLLVEAIGGSWGATELEEIQVFRKGLVWHHSATWWISWLLFGSHGIQLCGTSEQGHKTGVQALYVLLRQSLLAPHDKKKILLEHPGELKYEPVVKFFRLLGMFFLELQGSRQSAN